MKRVFLLFAVASITLTVAAQESQKMLSFEDALTRTMGFNPQIEANKYEEKAADYERKAAIGLRMPKLGVTGAYTYMSDDISIDLNGAKPMVTPFIEALGASGALPAELLGEASKLLKMNWDMTIQDREFAIVGATATLPIYMGGKINVANRAARINQETAEKKGTQDRNGLVSELVERYYGLVLANQVVKVREQVVDGVGVHLQDAIALESSGVIAKGDRLYAEVKMAEARRELMSAKLQAETIHSALCNTINEPTNTYIPVSTMFFMRELANVTYFQDIAKRKNPLLNQVELKKQLAQEGVKLQRAEFLPQIVATGGYNLYDYQKSKYIPNWAVGAGLKLNIFDGLHREFKYSAAKNTARQVAAISHKATSDIDVLIEKLYNQMRNYHDQMPSIDASMEFAKEYLRIKEAAFKEGIASSADVIDAQLNLAKIRTERIQAAYYYDLMLARLLEAAGVSDEFVSYANSPSAIRVQFE